MQLIKAIEYVYTYIHKIYFFSIRKSNEKRPQPVYLILVTVSIALHLLSSPEMIKHTSLSHINFKGWHAPCVFSHCQSHMSCYHKYSPVQHCALIQQ